jgi:hypothetical protein
MDQLEFSRSGRRWRVDSLAGFDLAVTLEFDGPQPRFFAAQGAEARPLVVGGFNGDVARGASCNCSIHMLAPHCHGTHTESVAHVTVNGPTVAALTPARPTLAVLVTVQPVPADGVPDPVITRAQLERASSKWAGDPWDALVVRTLPNDPAKARRHYAGPCPAPYFTPDAMRWIVERGVVSLVVDLPSLDRADDDGALAAHRIYWGLAPGERDATAAARRLTLVTELAFVPSQLDDGLYLLALQVPAFAADAAPSRPVLHPVAEVRP